jgi:hypothetical protein
VKGKKMKKKNRLRGNDLRERTEENPKERTPGKEKKTRLSAWATDRQSM